MAELTPMKKQYKQIKDNYPDCLLFFRLGDFYELFDDDARTASRELDIALTTRDRNVENPDDRTPMCGVPFHSCDPYIAKLIAKGYKVAICEQTEDPALAKGLVSRDVIRVITPGTVTESSMLDEAKSNYISAVWLEGERGGIAFCDITTGEFCCADFVNDPISHILNELGRFAPSEVILSEQAGKNRELTGFITGRLDAMPEYAAESFEYNTAAELVCRQFGYTGMKGTGLEGCSGAVSASGALLEYIIKTQKFDIAHITKPEVFFGGRYMELDWSTRRSLELTESLRSGEKKGSLLWVLDKTKTPMGGRMLRSWVERPLLSAVAIKRRLSAVDELRRDSIKRSEIIAELKGITDLQRLVGRCVYGTAGGRDLRAIANCLLVLPRLGTLLEGCSSRELREIAEMDMLGDIREIIDEAICDEPPFSVREGGIVRDGFSEEVDKLRDIRDNGSRMVTELEARERERTGIKKLKVGYNRVFGYYIDIPRSAGAETVPDEYIRKQTLVSNERYFTQELKELENSLLTARDRINELEYEIFSSVRSKAAENVDRIQHTADLVARLDALCSLAETASRNGYTMPEVDVSRKLRIIEGRHPVVEQSVKDVMFVPNDTYLNDAEDRVAIVTGPNMAGKSTYMRQTALIVIMAQIGSFVPAKSAEIGIVDRVFTRIGASDDLASGQSTFMVEMNEMANILKYATADSLLILDEIGRGTSTYDGMAIARAVLEFCADKRRLGAKTMFATHYHELSVLEGELPGVRNYNITAKKQGGNLVFLRRIVRGAADDSYGIEVAKLAGLPDTVIGKAKEYLRELTAAGAAPVVSSAEAEDDQISFSDVGADEIRRTLCSIDVNTLTPLEAMNLLFELQRKAQG